MADKYEEKAKRQKKHDAEVASMCGAVRTRELLTPEIAQAWLKKNYYKNRKISKNTVNKYASDIRNGLWVEYIASPIIFDTHDQLINGQHRCSAVVAAQKEIWVDVIRGARESDYHVIDAGKSRTAADAIRDYPYHNALAGMISSLVRYEEYEMDNPYSSASNNPVSIQQIVEYLHEYDRGDEPSDNSLVVFCRWGDLAKRNGLLGSGVVSCVGKLTYDKDPEKSTDFFNQLATGEGLYRGDPIYTLRNKLVKARTAIEKPPSAAIFGWTVKAWNAFIEGKKLGSIHYNPKKDKAPELI